MEEKCAEDWWILEHNTFCWTIEARGLNWVSNFLGTDLSDLQWLKTWVAMDDNGYQSCVRRVLTMEIDSPIRCKCCGFRDDILWLGCIHCAVSRSGVISPSKMAIANPAWSELLRAREQGSGLSTQFSLGHSYLDSGWYLHTVTSIMFSTVKAPGYGRGTTQISGCLRQLHLATRIVTRFMVHRCLEGRAEPERYSKIVA